LGALALLVGLAPANAMQSGAANQSPVGRIAGRVSVIGAVEKPKPLPVFKSRSFCGASVPNETLLVTADGRLRNAAVILRSPAAVAAAQPKTVVLDNQRCAFTPHVQIAPLGSELLLKNSDPILHTVHARMGQETLFNIGLPKWRQVIKRLDRIGVIRIDCDVLHTWMSAVIIVTDSPYSFISNERGEFFFDGLSAGVYEIDIWHERLGRQTQRLAVRDQGTTDVEVFFALEK
jgi:hypothetical protein